MSSFLVLLACLSVLCLGCAARPPEAGPVADGTNREFAHTVTTAASPAAVWGLWTDAATWPAWDTELDAATLDGPFAEGAEGRLVPTSGPSSRFVIEDVVEGRAYTLATRLPLGWLRVRRSWADAEGGGIAVTHEVTFSGLGGRLLSGRLGPRFRRALPVAMDRLRAMAEASE